MDLFFNLAVTLPLVVWACMLLFPQRRFTLATISSPWPFVALAVAWGVAWIGQVSVAGVWNLDLASLQGALASPWGTVASTLAWQGLTLALGVWIFRDARFYGLRPEPFLLATLLFGPVGPAAYLWQRQRRDRSGTGRPPERFVN